MSVARTRWSIAAVCLAGVAVLVISGRVAPQDVVEIRVPAPNDVQVILYSTSWCGYCRQARAWLQLHGVAYTDLDIERDAAAQARMRVINPSGGVPTLDVDGEILHGWSAPNLEAALALAAERRAQR